MTPIDHVYSRNKIHVEVFPWIKLKEICRSPTKQAIGINSIAVAAATSATTKTVVGSTRRQGNSVEAMPKGRKEPNWIILQYQQVVTAVVAAVAAAVLTDLRRKGKKANEWLSRLFRWGETATTTTQKKFVNRTITRVIFSISFVCVLHSPPLGNRYPDKTCVTKKLMKKKQFKTGVSSNSKQEKVIQWFDISHDRLCWFNLSKGCLREVFQPTKTYSYVETESRKFQNTVLIF